MSNGITGILRAQDGQLAGKLRGECGQIGTFLNANCYGSTAYEDYTGSYDVTPLITAQRLPTADKHMTDDVLIRMIPTSEVQNSAGGVTFTIGG